MSAVHPGAQDTGMCRASELKVTGMRTLPESTQVVQLERSGGRK